MKRLALFIALIFAFPMPATAGFYERLQAYYAGDYATALKEWRPLAEQGDANTQHNLGLMYYNGRGVPQDYVQAHMWWNLAAAAGQKNAAKNRDIIARQMTPSQIAEAQRLAKGGKVGEPVTGWAALSRNDIKAVQRALNAAGYDAGPADGIRGKRTETALAAYQRHKGLPVGSPESETLKALGLR
jgi:TPR repeat protein